MDASELATKKAMLSLMHQEIKAVGDRFAKNPGMFQGEFEDMVRADRDKVPWPPSMANEDGEFDGAKVRQDCLETEIRAITRKYAKYLDTGKGKTHRWIGINPPCGDHEFKDLYDKLNNLELANYQAVVEAHTELGFRPHIHMILYDIDTRPNRIITKLSKHFKCATNFIECKTSNKLTEHLEYLKGNKKDEKKELVKQDIALRTQMGIPHFINRKL